MSSPREIPLRDLHFRLPEACGFSTVWFDLPGVRLHAAVAGPESGQPVILLHGFPEFWYSWIKQIGPLAEAGFRVIAPDQRGYNLSSKPKGISAYRIDILAQDIINLMDSLGYAKARVVGHDWGGAVAWAVAALHPERVERLAILDSPYPPVVIPGMLAHPRQILKSYYVLLFQLPGIAESMLHRDHWKTLIKNMKSTTPAGTFTPEDFDYYRETWEQEHAITSMLSWYRALVQRPVRLPANPHLKMPVRVIWGGQDFALGRPLAEASIKMCENGELVMFEGANHWIQREEAEKVNQKLLEFFSA